MTRRECGSSIPRSRSGLNHHILLKRFPMEMTALPDSARKARNENTTATLILSLNRSLPNRDTHRWWLDAAAADADMRRYANTCSETGQVINHLAR